jgi:beta-lactamase regulating signal transducer with metallopeptidase domain
MEYLLKANAVVILFYICYKLFLQRDTFFESNRYFLLVGLIIACIIPFIIIPIYTETSPLLDTLNFVATENVVKTEAILEESFNFFQFIKWVYLIGITVFSIKFIIECIGLFNILTQNEKKKKEGYTYIETKKDHSPFSFFKYIVYNPSRFNIKELEQIMLHEKIHARQYHSIDILFTKIAAIIFWFNPFVWLYNKALHQNLEFIVDNTIQQKITDTKSYQTLLLKTAIQQQQIALVNNFNNSLIKKRIIMLNKSKSKPLNLWKFTLILPVLALFLMSFSTKEIYAQKNNIENIISNNLNETIEVVLITKDFTAEDFENAKKHSLKYKFDLVIRDLKRNTKGEIIYISIIYNPYNEQRAERMTIAANGDDVISSVPILYNKKTKAISFGNLR